MDTPQTQPNNPLHGVTLETIVTFLADRYGWIELNRRIEINCFYSHPSVKSSLKFLRHHDWARTQVENLYLETVWRDGAESRDGATTLS